MMLDYLFNHADEASALADPLLALFTVTAEDGSKFWGPQVIRDVRVEDLTRPTIQHDAETNTDFATYPVLAGFHVMLMYLARDEALLASPNCVLAADRDLAEAGEPRETYVVKALVPVEELATLRVSPIPAGAAYTFGG